MFKKMVGYFTLPLLLLVGICWENSVAQSPGKKPGAAVTGEALSLNKSGRPRGAGETFAPGPDVIAGNMADLGGYGFVGFPPTQIGLAMGINLLQRRKRRSEFYAIAKCKSSGRGAEFLSNERRSEQQ
jgi:hypothetical protein